MVHDRTFGDGLLYLELNGSDERAKLRDIKTGLLWAQKSGKGYQGQKALAEIPSKILTWRKWRSQHPQSELMVTPSAVDVPASNARVSAHLVSVAGFTAAAGAVGWQLATPIPLLLGSTILLALAAMQRGRETVSLQKTLPQNDKKQSTS